MKKVIEGYDVRLGAKLGVITIRGRKFIPTINEAGEIKGAAPNWKKTKELWDSDPVAKAQKRLVYCFNEHSDGITYKLHWFKKNVIIKNKDMYGLSFARDNRRAVNTAIYEGKEYAVITPKEV